MSKIDHFGAQICFDIELKGWNPKTNLNSSTKNFPMKTALQINLSLKLINFSFISKFDLTIVH